MSAHTRLLLIDFLGDKPPAHHPQIRPYIDSGWAILSMRYRLFDERGPQLLVRLAAPR